MRLFEIATMACALGLVGIALAPSAKADEWDRKTVVKFSQPIEVPGVHLKGLGVLPAGTYVFKVLDSQANRHIVQIFSEDESKVYATILAIPNYRLQSTDKTVIMFSERPAGQPEALRGWFYPGRRWGEEFVYPKARAVELAKTSNEPVLYSETEIQPEVTAPIPSVTEPVVAQMQKAPVKAVQPSGQEVELAQVVTAPPVEMAQARPQALPATGSSLPLTALLGLLALGAAAAIGFTQKLIG